MNRKAYKDRLREIQMSEHDAAMYEQFSSQVTKMDVKHAFYLIKNVKSIYEYLITFTII